MIPADRSQREAAHSRPPLLAHPVDLLAGEQDRGQRRGVVGLVEAALLDARWRGRGTPGIQRPDAVIRSMRSTAAGEHGRQPQAAVGGEALLGGEVVDVGLAQVDPQAAGGGGGVDEHEGVVGEVPSGRAIGMATPVEVSLWVRQ